MQFRLLLTIPCAAAMLTACDSAEDVSSADEVVQTPVPQLTSTPTPMQAQDGSPLATGSWTINESASGASARFGQNGSDALLIISCNAENRTLSLAIKSDASGTQAFVLEAGGAAARLDTVSDGSQALPYQVAAIAMDAPVFAGFVQAGGTIQITNPGGNVLRVPAAAGIRRVFEACT